MADLLSIGRSGLGASKTAIENAGHNLSNVNTEGYSRQRIVQSTNLPITKSGLIQGTGVRVTGINRFHDPYIEKRLESSITDHNYFKERMNQLGQVENIFNETDSEGLNKILNRFYNAFRELANQPENETIRSVVRDSAQLVTRDFRRIRETLDNIAKGIDSKLEQEISDINNLVQNITKLNKNITAMEASGDQTGDLRDQRDLLVRSLAESIPIKTYLDNKGQFVVNADGVGTLVAGGEFQELIVSNVGKENSPYGLEGSAEIFFKERPSVPVGEKFTNGRIGSLLKTRNSDLSGYMKDIDDLAYELIQTTNAIHRRGFVNRPIDENTVEKVTGIDFFQAPKERLGASSLIELSADVKDDLRNITTALAPNAPGDNRIALAISKLQHEKFFAEGTKTFEEHFLSSVGRIGVSTGKARLDTEQTEGILAQMKSLRERLAGVSIDEETASLMKFQQSYEASARMLKTADEMFQTVINIKR